MFLGRTLVFYSLSPYYGALGLVIVALRGCVISGFLGFSFIALVLILIYMGGMLVVFVYSTAISAERYPIVSKFKEIFILVMLISVWIFIRFDTFLKVDLVGWETLVNLDFIGSRELFKEMGWYLIIGAYILLVALIVALVLTYGSDYRVLKAL